MLQEDNNYLSLGYECFLDINRQVLLKDNWPVSLSRLEFRLLYFLAQNLERIVLKEEMIRYVWGQDSFVSNEELHVYVCRVRAKLEQKSKQPRCILSIRTVGYVLYPRKKNNE